MSGKVRKGGGGSRGSRVLGGGPGLERSLARLAARQHGVVTRRQALALGFTADQLDYQLRRGRMRRLFRGAYIVGALTSPLAREMAAVLLCGDGAVLSHASAARLWKRLASPGSDLVHVTVVGRKRGHRPGIRVHCVQRLAHDEVTRSHGIPVTTAARTVLDLAASLAPRELEQLVASAERSHLASRGQLSSLLVRHQGRAGSCGLRAIVEVERRPALTRSRAARRFLALTRKAGLPGPEANFRLERYELDFYRPEQRFAVEVDDFHTHGSTTSFESDRRRDADLAAQGVQVIRVTRRQIADEPERVVAVIAQALVRAEE